MDATELPGSNSNLWRWLAVLPAAFLAYIGLQFLNIVGSALDFRHFLDFHTAPQLISTFIGACGFVVVGAKIAPSRQALTAAVLLALVIAIHVLTLLAAIEGSREELLLWLSVPVAVVGGAAGLFAVRDDEAKELAMEAEEAIPVAVNAGGS